MARRSARASNWSLPLPICSATAKGSAARAASCSFVSVRFRKSALAFVSPK